MQITAQAWNEYITRLSRLNQKAGQLMRQYIDTHGTGDSDALIAYAHALVTKYGEGSAELACQMYDALAEAANAGVPAAEPAEPADYGEVARMVNATKNQNPANLPNGVSRLVKRAGADTTLKNAVRDGAEWAWVPHGDTCPFCITLASNGWQKASSKVLKGGHADHIHANCDCEFAVRFHSGTSVAGYDPEKYLRQYRAAGSDVNAMRRIDYAARKDAINAQKRAAYAARKNFSVYSSLNMEPKPVTMQSISNVKSFNCETLDGAKQQQLQNAHKRLLMTAAKQPPGVEVGKAFDLNMKPLTQDVVGSAEGRSVKLPNFNVPYAVIHTHPACGIFSHGDLSSFAKSENLKLMTAIGHNGHIYAVEKSADYDAVAAKDIVWQLNAGIDRLKNIPRAELSDEQLLEQAEKLVWQAIKELQENGVRFYE